MDDANAPLVDAEDAKVILHREAHFGGQFLIMLDYYTKEGKGAILDASRVQQLARLEKELGFNLIEHLGSIELERIADAQRTYAALRDLCESEGKDARRPRLLAELILAEEDEEEDALAAVVADGEPMVPDLIRLLESQEFAREEAPGYGFAPSLAAKALGLIGSELAVIPLFEAIGHDSSEIDEEAVSALRAIGAPAKTFLLQALSKGPATNDTLRAAVALTRFAEDEEVSKASLDLLGRKELLSQEPLSIYLAICCSGLREIEEREAFRLIADDPRASGSLRETILEVCRWPHA